MQRQRRRRTQPQPQRSVQAKAESLCAPGPVPHGQDILPRLLVLPHERHRLGPIPPAVDVRDVRWGRAVVRTDRDGVCTEPDRVSPLHRSLSSLEKTRENPEAFRENSQLSLSVSLVFLAQPRAWCVPTPTSLRMGMTERVMPGTSRWERVCFGGSPNLAWMHARSRQRRVSARYGERVGNEADQTDTS